MFSLIFCLLGSLQLVRPGIACAQQNENQKDSVLVKKHSPTKAAIYSAVLPGLGQGYNKKYWKIPIIYAGFTVFVYLIVTNNNEYQQYKEAYTYVVTGDSSYTDNELVDKYSADQLQQSMDYYQRNMELSIILGSLWYIIQIIDASVDAHFFEYDISDDLSIKWEPMLTPAPAYNASNRSYGGVRITFNF